VTLPKSPDWSKPAAGAGDFTNTASSNFGCADTVNLGLMVAAPADLAAPRWLGFSDATLAVTAVNDYRLGKVQLPTAARIGPIAAPTSQAAPGAGAGGSGAGGAGAQP
jgi:pilus assembly protein CpaD